MEAYVIVEFLFGDSRDFDIISDFGESLIDLVVLFIVELFVVERFVEFLFKLFLLDGGGYS